MNVYLAAVFCQLNLDNDREFYEKNRPRYVLETFYSGEDTCKKALWLAGEKDRFLLDSGAFSFMNGAKASKKYLEEYLDRYIQFIIENDIQNFFELDVDTIFGIEFVETLRKRLEKQTGKKCIPVWHKGRGIEYWKRMVDEYEYIAIGGLVFHVKKKEYPIIKNLVDYARSKNVKVHGLGFTKFDLLDEFKFYSVDSTTWAMSAIRGQQLSFFDGKKIVRKNVQKNNKKVDMHKMCMNNYLEWIKYQKYMESKRW